MERLIFTSTINTIISVILTVGVICIVIFYMMRSKKKSTTIQSKIPNIEQLFLEFTENTQQVLWRMSVNTNKLTYISPSAEKVFGRPVELLNKDSDNWLSLVIPDDKPKLMAAINQVKQGTPIITVDIKILRADGFIAFLSNQLFSSKDEQGKLIAILGVTSDMTAQYYIALQKRLSSELNKHLSQTYNMKLFAKKTLQSICLAIGYDIAELWIFDEKESTLGYLVNWARDDLKVKFYNKKTLALSKKTENIFQVMCLQNNIIQYSTQSSHLKQIYLGASINLKEVVGIPIVASNSKIGVMCFYNRQILNLDNDGYKILSEFAIEFGEYLQNKLLIDQVKFYSDYDVLTGLYNQASFLHKISELIKENVKSIVVIKLRINNFNLINYALGYDVGNKILHDVSKKITEFTSSYSTSLSNIDMVALTEPGIYAFVSHEFNDQNSIIDFVNKLLEIVKKPIKKNKHEIFLTASVGISRYPQNGTIPSQLLRSAILALIDSSKEGSNQFKFATEDTIKKTSTQIEIENTMHKALKNNEFELYYQPKVSLKTGKIIGTEALIRWHDPKGTIRLPGYFIPICEESDLIIEINDWVLATAINDIARSENPIQTSINLSARQFTTSYNLLERLKQLIAKSGVNYKYLEMEVTETLLMTNRMQATHVILELKKMGISLSLDDFGTGYSSFAYLKDFAPDAIKIDKSFIDGVPGDNNSIKIINAMISVSHSLGLRSIAEGVETADQVKFLISAGCDEIQGYYFSKPITFSEIQAMIKSDVSLHFPE